MRDVYSRASRVVAWLGESITNDEAIFELISNPMKSWGGQILPKATTFLNRSYFTRVWIVQEVLLAQVLEVWCGEHRADGDILSAELLRFIVPSYSFDDQATHLTPMARAWESSGRKLLSYGRIWKRQDPDHSGCVRSSSHLEHYRVVNDLTRSMPCLALQMTPMMGLIRYVQTMTSRLMRFQLTYFAISMGRKVREMKKTMHLSRSFDVCWEPLAKTWQNTLPVASDGYSGIFSFLWRDCRLCFRYDSLIRWIARAIPQN